MTPTEATSAALAATTDREVTMLNTTAVYCPALVCTCGGAEVVTATYGRKSVKVSACQPLLAQGWTGPAVVLWHNQAIEMLVVA